MPHMGQGQRGPHKPTEGLRWESQAGKVVTEGSFEPDSQERLLVAGGSLGE